MAEYLTRDAVESVALNAPIPFVDSIPCNKGYVYHQSGTGIFVLRGIVNNPTACVARYEVEFTGNIAVPTGGAVTPISTAIVVSGEERIGSRSIFTPAAVDEYGNVVLKNERTVRRQVVSEETSAKMRDALYHVVTDSDGNSGECFLENEKFERLGKQYITDHAVINYSELFEEWFVTISENDYFNDISRNPIKEIKLEFIGIETGTGREIYKGVKDKRFYLRENIFPREEFAKWLVCGKKRRIDDGAEPRANIIFICNGEKEKVTYKDWNGVAAYSDTFNKNFILS